MERTPFLILNTSDIGFAVARCANELNSRFNDKKVVIYTVLKGGMYFAVDLSRLLTFDHELNTISVSTYKSSQKQSKDSYFYSLTDIDSNLLKDKYVIILDELYDSGTTLNTLVDYFHQQGRVPLDHIFTCVCFRKIKVSVTRFVKPCLIYLTYYYPFFST